MAKILESDIPDATQPDAAAPPVTQTGRLLVDTHIDGKHYPINSVLILHEDHAQSLVAAGAFDTSPEAVAYATSELGAETIDLTA